MRDGCRDPKGPSIVDVKSTVVAAEKVIEKYKSPALLVSFGKDSHAMWHMLRHIGLPVICYRTPWQTERWWFANRMIAENQITAYDYPPSWTALQEKDGAMELVSAYDIGNGKVIGIRQRLHHVEKAETCVLHECVNRPLGGISFRWDLLISAQKKGDTDHFGGTHDVTVDVKQTGGADVFFPMRNWSDEEVWEYHKKHSLPRDTLRYDTDELGFSGDRIEGCFRCIHRSEAPSVSCPRLGGLIVNNISSQMNYLEHQPSI